MPVKLGSITSKPGVEFTVIAPGGFRILSALDQAALTLGIDLVITSACDGAHAGSDDPHHHGQAMDVRVHDFPPETCQRLLQIVMDDLSVSPRDMPLRVAGGLATQCFFGVLEGAGTDNFHLHLQVRKGCCWPPDDRPRVTTTEVVNA